jgi:hypothetical protein
MAVASPLSLLGQNPSDQAQAKPSAILHTQGGVWVNGEEAHDATAIMPGDVLETKTGFSATLNLDGSEVLIQQEAVATFDGDRLELDHGSVAVGTSKGFKVRVNCITVVPVLNEWTQYEVSDVNGTVHVAARKLDVNVNHEGHGKSAEKSTEKSDESQKATVREGEQSNRDESEVCGAPERVTGARFPVDPKWIAAGAGGTGVLLWLLLHGGGGKPPISSSQP